MNGQHAHLMRPAGKALRSVIYCLAIVFASSCGYKVVTEDRATLAGGAEKISVPLSENRTIEPALEDVFTMQLKRIILSDGRLQLVQPKEAEAELKCVLKDLSDRPVSYSEAGRISARETSFSVECMLWDRRLNELALALPELSASEVYPVGNAYLANEQARGAALREVSKQLSESVRSVLLDGF